MPVEPRFQPGDVVRLKSQGPSMTVLACRYSPEEHVYLVQTVWLDMSGIHQRDWFPEYVLKSEERR